MPSLTNRVISIYNKKTSMRLAPIEWEALDAICQREHIARKKLFELIDTNKDSRLGLTSSVRLFSIIYYRNFAKYKQSYDSDTFYSPIFEAIRGII